ncbi:MAG: hypothetical protein ACUVQ1_06200 [Candidatus Kapaibacteriales bacterium]
MFDSVLNLTTNKIFSLIDGLEEPVYFSDLLKINNLPAPYLKFFEAEKNRQIYELKLLHSGLFYFDFNHPEFSKIYNEFLTNLHKIVRLDKQALTDLVFEAVKFRLHFLIQPRKILLDFVFKNSLQKIKEEVLLDLEYFNDYNYLIDELKMKINRYKSEYISRIEFQILVSQIDNHFFTQSKAHDILSVLLPLCEFFSLNNFDSEKSRIPALALYYFFKDKEYVSLFNFFLSEFEKDSNTMYNLSQIEEILFNTFVKLKATSTEAVQEEQPFYFSFADICPEVFLPPFHSIKSTNDAPVISEKDPQILTPDENTSQFEKHKDIVDILNKIDNDFSLHLAKNEFDNPPREITFNELDQSELLFETSSTAEDKVRDSEEFIKSAYQGTEENVSVELAPAEFENQISERENINKETFEDITIQSFSNLAQDAVHQELIIDDNEDIKSFEVFPSLTEFISPEMRQKLIEELFYSLEEEYDNLVKKVDNSQSLEKALNEVETYYKEFGIFEEMPIAKKFIELVQKKFNKV